MTDYEEDKLPVVFVDDDQFYSIPWIEELAGSFDVRYEQDAAEAVSVIAGIKTQIALVLDVMMPPPEGVPASETEDGQTTGIWVLRSTLNALQQYNCPVILLTNVELAKVKSYVSSLGENGLHIDIFPKKSAMPGKLLARVKAMANAAQASQLASQDEVVVKDYSKRRTVIAIDDVVAWTEDYESALAVHSEFDVDVLVANTPEGGLQLIRDTPDVDVIILDMMMPSGTMFTDEETQLGRFTGVVVAERIRRIQPYVPIVLLSDASLEEVRSACKKLEKRLFNCIFFSKSSLQSRRLAEKMDVYFSEGKFEKPSESLLQRVFGALILQPNFGGVGVDIKKLRDG